jgi:hypothetical protein
VFYNNAFSFCFFQSSLFLLSELFDLVKDSPLKGKDKKSSGRMMFFQSSPNAPVSNSAKNRKSEKPNRKNTPQQQEKHKSDHSKGDKDKIDLSKSKDNKNSSVLPRALSDLGPGQSMTTTTEVTTTVTSSHDKHPHSPRSTGDRAERSVVTTTTTTTVFARPTTPPPPNGPISLSPRQHQRQQLGRSHTAPVGDDDDESIDGSRSQFYREDSSSSSQTSFMQAEASRERDEGEHVRLLGNHKQRGVGNFYARNHPESGSATSSLGSIDEQIEMMMNNMDQPESESGHPGGAVQASGGGVTTSGGWVKRDNVGAKVKEGGGPAFLSGRAGNANAASDEAVNSPLSSHSGVDLQERLANANTTNSNAVMLMNLARRKRERTDTRTLLKKQTDEESELLLNLLDEDLTSLVPEDEDDDEEASVLSENAESEGEAVYERLERRSVFGELLLKEMRKQQQAKYQTVSSVQSQSNPQTAPTTSSPNLASSAGGAGFATANSGHLSDRPMLAQPRPKKMQMAMKSSQDGQGLPGQQQATLSPRNENCLSRSNTGSEGGANWNDNAPLSPRSLYTDVDFNFSDNNATTEQPVRPLDPRYAN